MKECNLNPARRSIIRKRIYDCLPFNNEDDGQHLEIVIEKFEYYTIVQINETFERYRVNSRSQETSEGIDTCIAAQRTLANSARLTRARRDRLWHSKQTHTTEDSSRVQTHIRTMHRHLQKCRGYKRSNEGNFKLQQRKRLRLS